MSTIAHRKAVEKIARMYEMIENVFNTATRMRYHGMATCWGVVVFQQYFCHGAQRYLLSCRIPFRVMSPGQRYSQRMGAAESYSHSSRNAQIKSTISN